MEFLIQKASLSDIDSIKEIESEGGLSSWSKDDYRAEVSRPDSIFLVVKKGAEVCGFLLARLITMNSSNFNAEIEIYNIGVRNSYRRKSLGSKLINQVTQKDNKVGEVRVFLEVRESNHSAVDFYHKNNFIKSGFRKNFYSDPLENAILMSFIWVNSENSAT